MYSDLIKTTKILNNVLYELQALSTEGEDISRLSKETTNKYSSITIDVINAAFKDPSSVGNGSLADNKGSLIGALIHYLSSFSVLTLRVSLPVSSAFIEILYSDLKSIGLEDFLLNVEIDYSLDFGCVIYYNGQVYEHTLQTALKKSTNLLHEMSINV